MIGNHFVDSNLGLSTDSPGYARRLPALEGRHRTLFLLRLRCLKHSSTFVPMQTYSACAYVGVGALPCSCRRIGKAKFRAK